MRYVLGIFLILVLCPLSSRAQDSTGTAVELGFNMGVAGYFPRGGGSPDFVFSIPSGTFYGLSSLYLTIIAQDRLMIEPQLLLQLNSDEALFSGMLQLGWLIKRDAKGSPYVAVHAGYIRLGDYAETPALGAAFGMRMKMGTRAASRVEIRFRSFSDHEFPSGELAFNLGIGVVFH